MFNVFRTSSQSLAWGVFVEASFFNHACMPNVTIWRDDGSAEFECVAVHDIPAGTELTISYLGTAGGLKERRDHLKESYFFHCMCVQCREEEQNEGKSETNDRFTRDYMCSQPECVGIRVPRGPPGEIHCPYWCAQW